MPQPQRWEERIGRRTFLDYIQEQRVADNQLSGILRDAAIESDRLVQRTLGTGIGARVRREQYRLSSLALRQIQRDMWGDVSATTLRGIQRASAVAAGGQARLAGFLARVAQQEGISNAADLRRGFELAARNSSENVRSRLINNIDLSPRVYKNQDLAFGRIDRIVNRGIATNKSAREIARDVRGYIRPDTPGGASYAAKRLARTEINNAFHTTQLRSQAVLPFVEGVKWELSGSHPRVDRCDDLATANHDNIGSGVFRPQNVPPKPHPNCLCFTIAVTPSPEKFIDSLIGGEYDNFLEANGYTGLGEVRRAG